MTRRAGAPPVPVRVVGLVLALVGLSACGAAAAGPAALPAPAAAPAAVPEGAVSTTVDGVELQVTAFHLLPPAPGDAEVERAAAALRVPVSGLAQMHVLLTVRNTGEAPRSLADDVLVLGHGPRTVPAAAGPVFAAAPLPAGGQQETAAGFWVALRAGQGQVVLRWTHGSRTTVLPIGGVRQGD